MKRTSLYHTAVLLFAAITATEVAKTQVAAQAASDSIGCYKRGLALQRALDYPGAVEFYRQAISLDPHFADAYNSLCVAYANLNMGEEAIEACHRAVSLKPDLEIAHYNLGLVLSALGRREEAEASFERGALKLRAEQIWARDGTLKRRGGYVLGAWRFSQHWEAVTRADWLTTNVQKANTTSIAYIAGANYFLGKHVKIGSNAGAQHDQGPKSFSSVFLAQIMFSF